MTQEEKKGGVYLGENGYVVNRSPNIELPFYIKTTQSKQYLNGGTTI